MITLIEDDDGLISALQALFKSKNLEAKHFISGEAYLETVKKETPEIETLETMKNLKAGVILLDVRLPGISGLETFERQKEIIPYNHEPIVIMTGHGEVDMAVSALKNGAFDFLTKPVQTDNLLFNIEKAYEKSYELLEMREFIFNFNVRFEKLTSREAEIAELIALYNPNKSIAEKLGISVRTIELHRSRIFNKMEVSSATEIAAKFEKLAYSKRTFLSKKK
jgi:two-component system response regulator DctR